MTTIIATKDMVLSDGKVTVGNRVDQLNFCKVRNIGNYLLGGAGRASSITKFFNWFETKVHAEELQSMSDRIVIDIPPDERDEDFYALIVTPDKEILLYENNDVTRSLLIEDKGYYAIGSGADFALAALDAGVSPEQAMEIAKQRDCYSGGDTFKVMFDEQLVIPETREKASELTREQLLDIVYGKEVVDESDSPLIQQFPVSDEELSEGEELSEEDKLLSEGWIKNTGSQPVEDGMLVDLYLQGWGTDSASSAENWSWELDLEDGTILYWKLAE